MITYRTIDNAVFTFAHPMLLTQWVSRHDGLWDLQLTTPIGLSALAIGVEDVDAATDALLDMQRASHVDMRSIGNGKVAASDIVRPSDAETATILASTIKH